MQTRISTKKLVTMAMLTALSVIFSVFIQLRGLFSAAPFLSYHAGDIPIVMGTLMYGPLAGVILSFLQTTLQLLLGVSQNGLVGWLMNFIGGGTLAFVIGFVYSHSKQTNISGIISIMIGSLAMTSAMVGWNLLITPIYMEMPREAVVKILIPAIIPFNLFRSGLNSILGFTVFKTISRFVKPGNRQEIKKSDDSSHGLT